MAGLHEAYFSNCHIMALLRQLYNTKFSYLDFNTLAITRIHTAIPRKENVHNLRPNAKWIGHKKYLCSAKVISTSFPNILDFTNCRDYLRSSISVQDRKLTPNDWEVLLEHILETLPAEPENINSAPIENSTENTIQDLRALTHSSKQRRIRGRTVKPYFCHSFALGVCAELENITAGLSLLDYMKESNENITNLHREFIFIAFRKKFARINDRDLATSQVESSFSENEEIEKVLSICNDAIRSEESGTTGYNQMISNVITTFAYTKKWMDGYELWDQLRVSLKTKESCENLDLNDNASTWFTQLHRCTKPLALAALKNDREDKFWEIINDPSFHLNHNYLRDGDNGKLEDNMDVFIQYLNYCTKIKFHQRPIETFDSISKLFEYFREHFVLVNMRFFRELQETFLENELIIQSSRTSTRPKCVKVSQNKFGGPPRCSECRELISSPPLGKKDFDNLKDSIISKLIVKDDVYKSSNPKELRKFEALLSENKDYDIVVDGLNVCGMASKWIKDPKKEKVFDYRTTYKSAEFILLTVLKILQERGLKTLLIHRKHLKKFRCFKQIQELCHYVILDDTSIDDAFFIAAALNSGPNTYILTNDLLRQHNVQLRDPYLQQIFSHWQMQVQVKFKWLSYKVDKSKDKYPKGYLYNEHDGTVQKPQLFFPDNRVIRATQIKSVWHVPILPSIPTQTPNRHKLQTPSTMVRPNHWACVS